MCVVRNSKAVYCLPSQHCLLSPGQIIKEAFFLSFIPSLPPSDLLSSPLPASLSSYLPSPSLIFSLSVSLSLFLGDKGGFQTQENRDTSKLPGHSSEAGHSIFLRTKTVIPLPFLHPGKLVSLSGICLVFIYKV